MAIKIINKRDVGELYHYAHFICDCLFPEIINNVYLHKRVIRIHNIKQTIGIFNKIYENVMQSKNIELPIIKFNQHSASTISINGCNAFQNTTKEEIEIFRNFIFNRFQINIQRNINYPEVILIQRGNQPRLTQLNSSFQKNGKERREINKMYQLKRYLNQRFSNRFKPTKNSIRPADLNLQRFKTIELENMPFSQQIRYFKNAKLIIGIHGAAFANNLFCVPGTHIVEVTSSDCPPIYPYIYFDNISNLCELNHYKCNNNIECIIETINNIVIE